MLIDNKNIVKPLNPYFLSILNDNNYYSLSKIKQIEKELNKNA